MISVALGSVLLVAAIVLDRLDRLPPPILDAPVSLADAQSVSENFLVPETSGYDIGLWFKDSEGHVLDPVSLSWALSRGTEVIAQGSKDRLYTHWGDRVGSTLWSGRLTPGAHSLQVAMAGGSQLLRSAMPRLIIQPHDPHAGPSLGFILLCGSAQAGIVGVCFLAAWGVGKWRLFQRDT